jgi:D-serine dehydratase
MPPGHVTSALNDQHLFLDAPADTPLRLGDMVGFGISHPCTTFDKWRMLAVVNDDYDVIDTVTTAF